MLEDDILEGFGFLEKGVMSEKGMNVKDWDEI